MVMQQSNNQVYYNTMISTFVSQSDAFSLYQISISEQTAIPIPDE